MTVDRGYLRRLGYSSWDVHLNDRLCRPHVAGRFLIFSVPYGHCGTARQVSRPASVLEAEERGWESQRPLQPGGTGKARAMAP